MVCFGWPKRVAVMNESIRSNLLASVSEPNVARMHVCHEYSESFKSPNNGLHLGQVLAKQLRSLLHFFAHTFSEKSGSRSKYTPAKSNTKGGVTMVISIAKRSSS